MTSSTDLQDLVISAHGGLERWRELSAAHLRVRAAGALFTIKQQEGALADMQVAVCLPRQRVTLERFGEEGVRSIFAGDNVSVETMDGILLEQHTQVRSSFAEHRLTTPWDRSQLAYFAGYAIWTYLTIPFLFAEADVDTLELEEWKQSGDVWRRLQVTFPDRIATHNKQQIFYIDHSGLIRRHDYHAEVVHGGPAAHYTSAYRTIDGITVPTRRRVYKKDTSGQPNFQTTVVSLDLDEISFT